jgi:hypothetical protein
MMRRVLTVLFATSVLFEAAGCDLTHMRETSTARERAAADLGCPESEVNVHPVAGGGYQASGCNRDETLTCSTTTHTGTFFNQKVNEVTCLSGEVHDEAPPVDVNSPKEVEGKKVEKSSDNDPVFIDTLKTVLR